MLSWDKSEDAKFSHYQLFYDINSDFDTTNAYSIKIRDRNRTESKVEGLMPLNRYYFKLYVVDRDGIKSAPSSEVEATTTVGQWQVVKSIDLPGWPRYTLLNQYECILYVGGERLRGIGIIATASNTLIDKILYPDSLLYSIGHSRSLLFSADLEYLLMAHASGIARFSIVRNAFTQIDFYNDIFFGEYATEIRLNNNNSSIYLATEGDGWFDDNGSLFKLSMYDLKIEDSLYIDSFDPFSVEISHDEELLMITSRERNKLAFIATSTFSVANIINTGRGPYLSKITADGDFLFVTNSRSNTVSVIDIRKQISITEIEVGNNPNGICFSPNGTLAFISNNNSGNISIINTSSLEVVAIIEDVGNGPDGMSITSDGQTIYVANNFSEDIAVIQLIE